MKTSDYGQDNYPVCKLRLPFIKISFGTAINMLRKSIVITAVLLSLSHLAGAQTVFRSLEDVWRFADEHNVAIRSTAYELDKARYGKTQSYLAFTPQAGVTGAFIDNTSLQTTLIPAVIFGGPVGTYSAVQFGQKYIYSAGFTAQMDLVNLQTWFNVRVAKETEKMSKDSLGSTRRTVYQQIANLYYAYLLNKEAYRLVSQSAAVADSVYRSVNNKFKEGTLNMGNVDVAELNSERAQQTLTTAYFQMRTSANSLKALLGLSVNDSLAIESSIEGGMKKESTASFNEDPSVKLADDRVKLNLSMYKAANASFYPTVNVLYSNTTQQNDNKFEPFEAGGPSWYPARYWTLRASWNIFAGGTRWLQSKKSKISYLESQMLYDQAKRQADINDENLLLSYEKAAAFRAKAEHIMNLSLDNYRHITYRYEAGVASLDDRLNAFTDYINYQNQYLNSLSDMLVQLYQVKIRQQSF